MIHFTDAIVNKIKPRTFDGKSKKVVTWFGENISTPENRLIIGMSALATQPFIDLHNKNVDEKTRKVSCARTIGKTIAGMITGYSVRAGFIKLTRNYSELGEVGQKAFKKFFTPSNAQKDLEFAYKQYQNAMGMVLAIAGLLVTNFAIDAPLTNFITNKITKNMKVNGMKVDEVPNNEKN